MDVILPVLIGIGLSMDCFAVSLALGTTTKNKLLDTAIIIGLCFGLFQTGMILAGWAAGTGLLMYIAGFDHWLAFFLLALIGIKMIIEGFEAGDEKEPVFVLRIIPVIVLSIATSIDSLGVGISFAFLHTDILIPAIIIGIVAFIFSFGGVISGTRLKALLGKRIEIAGGLILVAIGLNILFTHIFAP
jgi:manganese efflux pump family protein